MHAPTAARWIDSDPDLARWTGASVARQYRVGPGESSLVPPARRRVGAADVHGLSPRHWGLLLLLAEQGVLHTDQVTTLMFGSRPAASRYLGFLTRAGLVWRFVYDDDPSHLAYYELSTDGIQALAEHLRRAGRPVPATLGDQISDHSVVTEFFVGLATETRNDGPGCLYRWRRALDTVAWLRGQGIERVHPRAYGVWIEEGVTVTFLLHVDHDEPSLIAGDPAPPPSHALAGYRHASNGVPATAILVITSVDGREAALHRELTDAPLPVSVATTTVDRLYAVDNAGEAIWSVTDANPTELVRLIDVSHR
jgi:hypothetical protein